MTTTVLAPLLKQAFLNNNGQPLAGGQLFSYQAGTTIPLATYTDQTGNTSNANPIILNARGECSCWIAPNVAYKFVLEDSAGNTIWTVDQVTNAQLLTLYGGVDTGSTNAYLLNFTSSFASYTDGIVIFWVPSHTNTGPSTINVNGLGVVNITNQNGSALGAGEIIVNQVCTIMYKGGAFLLLSSGTVSLSGTFTTTLTGGTFASTTISYWVNGYQCMLRGGLSVATSTSTAMTMPGLPAAVTPATGAATIACVLEDNGSSIMGWAQVNSGTGTITFGAGLNNNQSGFTASGTKGINAGWCISYPLG